MRFQLPLLSDSRHQFLSFVPLGPSIYSLFFREDIFMSILFREMFAPRAGRLVGNTTGLAETQTRSSVVHNRCPRASVPSRTAFIDWRLRRVPAWTWRSPAFGAVDMLFNAFVQRVVAGSHSKWSTQSPSGAATSYRYYRWSSCKVPLYHFTRYLYIYRARLGLCTSWHGPSGRQCHHEP
jgi:hypothetical protein